MCVSLQWIPIAFDRFLRERIPLIPIEISQKPIPGNGTHRYDTIKVRYSDKQYYDLYNPIDNCLSECR